jgi:hypothetical protein
MGEEPQVRSAAIAALMEDIDCFAKEWTKMFDDLHAGPNLPEGGPSKVDSSTRIHPAVRHESASICGANNPTGKRIRKFPLPSPSGSAAPTSTSEASTLANSSGEMVRFDVAPASLAHWQRRDNAIVKDVPIEDKKVSNHYFSWTAAVNTRYYLRDETYLEYPPTRDQIVLKMAGTIIHERWHFETRLSQ